MSRIRSKSLHELIKSLSKNEKRYFKVASTSSGSSEEDRKILILFDLLNKNEDLDDNRIPLLAPSIKKSQISNLKAYLYEKILQCIRQYKASKIPDIRIRELIDFAQILQERRLPVQARNSLKKAKKMASEYDNLELQLEIIKLEKQFHLQSFQELPEEVDPIIDEVNKINSQIRNIHIFSNLFIKLNSLYTKIGHIRDEEDFIRVKEYFYSSLPEYIENDLSTIEKMNLYRLYTGYYFFVQDFENAHTYSRKLISIFETFPVLTKTNTDFYISTINILLIAQFKLFKYKEYVQTNQKLLAVNQSESLHINEHLRIKLLKYFYTHHINIFFMRGDFDEGLKFIMEEHGKELHQLTNVLEPHSAMILNYKIACLYFGAGKFSQSVRWLNKVINSQSSDLREDLHCFARIMNLVCHFEMGNYDVISYYIISTYRFLLKKSDLHLFQKYILHFLKNLKPEIDENELIDKFKQLKEQLSPLTGSPFEKRAFIYFDIISWLESKIEKRQVQDVIRQKFTLHHTK